MSKAFLRESDFDDPAPLPPTASLLPPGTRNLLTPVGAQRLRNELARLVEVERPALAGTIGDPEARRQLLALDLRIRTLRESLRTAEVVDAPADRDGVVRFGAAVTVREPGGLESRYRLVGVDEADPENGDVSWMSPIARALLNGRKGERVTFKVPAGLKTLEIVSVDYDAPPRG